MAPGADAYVVAVRDDVAMVVAVKVSEARVVPPTRLAGDGQEIIQSELVGGDAESSVLAVVRRNAATDIMSQASWRAPRPLVVEVAPTASVVVAGEADSLGQASADRASFDLIPDRPDQYGRGPDGTLVGLRPH